MVNFHQWNPTRANVPLNVGKSRPKRRSVNLAVWCRHTMTFRPTHAKRFPFFGETLVSVHGRFPIARHALLTLLGCRRTPRHAGAENKFLNMLKTFSSVQRLSNVWVKRSQIVHRSLYKRYEIVHVVKPQSHRIVRFCDRTIGCDLVSYDRSAMFAAISFYNRHALVYSLRLVVGHVLICMIIYYLYLLANCRQVYCK